MQLLNIVLLHNQTPESYVNMFERLVIEDYVVKLKGERYIELLEFHRLESLNMYEGTFVTYIGIRSNAWFNQRSKEIETREGDDDLFANTKRVNFYFVPDRHKLCLLSGSKIPIYNIKAFMDEACRRLLGSNQVHSNYVTAKDEIAAAYDDLEIRKVSLTLSYSNKDFTEGFQKTFDNAAKDGNVALINMDILAAENENLNMQEGGMIDSLLNLATNNGNGSADITGIEVIRPTGKRKKVKTKVHRIRTSNYIRKILIEFSSLRELPMAVFNEVMTMIKSDD